MPPTPQMQRPVPMWALVIALFGGLMGGGTVGRVTAPTKPEPVEVVTQAPSRPAAPEVVAPVVVAPTVPVQTAPTWSGITVTVACPLATSDASLKAACPEYFTSAWKTAAVRDGYTSGSQKLAKVDCAMDHLGELDETTRSSLTCRDDLNAAIYGRGGSGGGKCAADLKEFCSDEHPKPGSNPTDLCLQAVVTDDDPETNLSDECETAVANHKYAEDQVTGRVVVKPTVPK